jgi:rhodanese-related sulfurtransferase
VEAKRLLDGGEDYVYLDVRTEAEFLEGHVPGALNVPVMVRGEDGGMRPNDDFLRVVEANLATDQPLLVGCRSGHRSQIAIDKMRAAGFSELHNVVGGFGGKKDASGRVVVQGWSTLDYPIERGDGGAKGYAALSTKAGG